MYIERGRLIIWHDDFCDSSMYNLSISIIVPVYNAEKTLHRCIDSILTQTFTDFELLLINDGSTDHSGEICDEYAARDSRIKVFHKENGGVSSARNVGLDNIKGEWVTFCDSDDYVKGGWLSIFVEQFSKKCDLIIQGFIVNKGIEAECYGFNAFGSLSNTIMPLLSNLMPGALWNKCFRNKIIKEKKLRFREDIWFKEDEEYLLRYLTNAKSIVSTSIPGYFYEMPDLAIKYNDADNFECDYSIANSLLKIFTSEIKGSTNYLRTYFCGLTNSFFFGVESNVVDKDRYDRFRGLYRNQTFLFLSLSVFSRYTLLFCNADLGIKLLRIKCRLVSLFN